MKIRMLFLFALLYFIADHAVTQDTQSPPDVEGLHDLVLKEYNILWEYPEYPYVRILFFDIDHDGVLEALVTCKCSNYSGSGGAYHLWEPYQFKNGQWQSFPIKMDGEYPSDDQTYGWVGGEDFSVLPKEGQKSTLVISSTGHGKENGGMRFYQDAFEVTIDNEGYLRSFPIPELTVNSLGKYNEDEDAYEVYMGDLEMREKLVPLPSVTLLPSEKQLSNFKLRLKEEGKLEEYEVFLEERKRGRLPATLAEFEAQQAALAKLTATAGTEKDAPPSSRPWLYLAILPVICVIFCFIWRKLRAKN